MSVRLLRIAAVVVPVALVLVVLHFLGPGIRRAGLLSDLPEGYVVLRDTPDYVIYGERGNERAAYASEVLTQFTASVRDEFGEMLSLEPPRAQFDVIVFSSHEHLSAYGQVRFDHDFERNGGFYLPSDRVLGVIDRGDAEEVVRALFHEGTHLMLDTWVKGTDHEWSVWLNEGLATWFEDSRIEDGKVVLGGVSRRTLATLRNSRQPQPGFFALMVLMSSEGRFQGPQNFLYYAASCLLVDFLMREKYRDRFAAYFEAERQPGAVRPGTFEDTIAPLGELEREYWEWVRTRE